MTDTDSSRLLAEALDRADPELEPCLEELEAELRDLREENERLRAEKEDLVEELRETNRGTLQLTAELEERYRKLFRTAVEGIYTTPPDADSYVLANPAMADVLGYDDGDELCRAVTSIRDDVFVDPDRYEEYHQRLQSTEQLDDFEYRVRRTDGEVRWLSDSATAMVDEDGTVEGFRGGVIDVTERKERERRLREHRDMLNVLNQIVRHDIRNDMNVILGWAQMLEGHVAEDRAKGLQRILDASEHVIHLTTIAREFVESLSSEETPELGSVDVSRVLRAELEAQRTSHPEADIRLSGDLPPVPVRANEMLASVFGNLLHNAVQHNDEDVPEVSVSADEREETVVVRIADNGPGIPERQKGSIFGKDEKGIESGGTGLGLFLVDVLVDQYGGDVWIEDNEPKGTVFAVELRKATGP